ncbi:hypothetical protein MMOR_56320 [Mycolicibacterium moriokaense]|uniref:Uncharacterized protein n=1 Tax=Mycolicibacterium moriokaense TaxID=39691 RepID=A0AAD1M9J6_9MYCO|nr:hypothetical protein MMOR_56320 [Mycolicibacterium moriokaense]
MFRSVNTLPYLRRQAATNGAHHPNITNVCIALGTLGPGGRPSRVVRLMPNTVRRGTTVGNKFGGFGRREQVGETQTAKVSASRTLTRRFRKILDTCELTDGTSPSRAACCNR